MSALDHLMQFFAATELHGTQLPGRPPKVVKKRRKRTAKRGAPCVQTRSLRLVEMTPHDILATLVFIKKPLTRVLVECLVLSHGVDENRTNAMLDGFFKLLADKSEQRRWDWLAQRPQVLKALLVVTLKELQQSSICHDCNGSQTEMSPIGHVSECSTCRGSGYSTWGLRRRWPLLKNMSQCPELTEYAYKKHVTEAHAWLFAHLTHRLHDAWLTVRHNRK